MADDRIDVIAQALPHLIRVSERFPAAGSGAIVDPEFGHNSDRLVAIKLRRLRRDVGGMRGLGTVAAAVALAARFVKCEIGKIAKLLLLPLLGAGDGCAANPCA